MKKIFFALMILAAMQTSAQRYMTKTAKIDFSSIAPMETIKGVNNAVACMIDSKTGNVDFILQVKSFVFDRQLLQEHFNENYMESDKFPKSTFKGQITNLSQINFEKDGTYDAKVAGKLTIHGVTKDVNYAGKINVKGGKVVIISNFGVLLSDYKIAIPSTVSNKISKEVQVNVNATLDKMN